MKVIHFEIPAENPEKLGEFYQKTFGWKINQWGTEQYWLADTGPKEEVGIGGAIYKKNDRMAGIINTISVTGKIEDAMKKVEEMGGTIKGEIMDIPGVGRNVMFFDPEGNLLGLLEPSAEMKNM